MIRLLKLSLIHRAGSYHRAGMCQSFSGV